MRRALLLLASTAALAALPATASAAEGPELPEVHCDPAACFHQLEGARECVSGAVRAVAYIVQGTPQPQECDPVATASSRSAVRPPDPHCDPMACPDLVAGAQDCANAAVAYVTSLGQPQGCDPWNG
jgi:hypothetical protein